MHREKQSWGSIMRISLHDMCVLAAAFADSHTAFKRSMPDGFAWEVLQVFSG